MAHLKHKIPWDLLDSIVTPKIVNSVERQNSFYFECRNVPVEKLIEFSVLLTSLQRLVILQKKIMIFIIQLIGQTIG